ncbi:MAG: hypothetical protein KU37_06135 [Sulfuricurvum sp. PC08-66]|nr:MAG: hypothetical protein KU37_06135 [Sulfuricurvum sp. PC08-66]
MLQHLTNDKQFEKLIKKHLLATMEYLFGHNIPFGVLCRIDHVTFEPPLEARIKADFRPLTLFFLAGYTFESAYIEGEYLSFEAGFGSDNTGSHVTVPLLDIIQIIVDETPIFVNSTARAKNPAAHAETTAAPSPQATKSARESSLEALMSNPENQKFFKK